MRIEEQDQLTMEQLPEDAVGRRVLCEGEQATVRYVGSVPPTTGGCPALCAGSAANNCLFPCFVCLNSLQSQVSL